MNASRTALVIAIVLGMVTVTQADVVIEWSMTTLDAIRADRTAPPKAARVLAMVHVAMFDAVNLIDGGCEPYLELDFGAPRGASLEAAAAAAAHAVLVAAYPGQAATFDGALEASLTALPDGRAKDDGVAVGQAVGAAILAERADDGAATAVTYTPGTEPGDWRPTPPAFAPAALPQWPNVKPFCVGNMAAVRRGGPPPLTSAEYTTAFNETKRLGGKNSTARTEEESQIALFWVDGPGTATPPGHWFQIARDVATQRGNTMVQNARLFALLGLAVCDAGICAWDNKYAYNDWRPITAIREADTDGNPDTEPDPTWESFIPTPAFPSYTSGHSTFSGAAAKILGLFYGTDEMAFSTTCEDLPGVVRSYTRFSEAADEAGRSRIYGGIHWEYDNQDGLAAGRELALAVFDNFLRPLDRAMIEVPREDVLQCGPIGIFPLGLLVLALIRQRATLGR